MADGASRDVEPGEPQHQRVRRFDRALQERAIRRARDPGAADHRPGQAPQLYREAQKLLVEDAPWVFVDHEVQIAATSKRVQGLKLHPSFDLRVETISLR